MPPCWFLGPPRSGLFLRRFSVTSRDLVLLLPLCVMRILRDQCLPNISQILCPRHCSKSILPIFHNRTLLCFVHRFMHLALAHRWVHSTSADREDIVVGAEAASVGAGDIAVDNRSRDKQDVREPVTDSATYGTDNGCSSPSCLTAQSRSVL